MSLNRNAYLINAKKIVFVGGGPIALATAFRWYDAGLQDITLVDSWLGSFTRTHEIARDTVDFIQKIIPFDVFDYSTGDYEIQLKDLEKRLFELISTSKIKLIYKKFDHFGSNRSLCLISKDKKEEERLSNVDLVVDCTGTKRAVIHNYNRQQEMLFNQTFFNVTPLTSDPPALYGKVRVISETESEIIHFHSPTISSFNSSLYISSMEHFYEMDWKECIPPTVYSLPRPKKNTTLTKGQLYIELPPHHYNKKVDHTYLLNYVTHMYRLVNNDFDQKLNIKLQQSKKPTKQMLSTFKVFTQKTQPPFKLGDKNYPFIMHLGDATCNLPFFTGKGLSVSVYLMNQIFNLFVIKDNMITTIDLKAWQSVYDDCLNEIEQTIENAKMELAKLNPNPWTKQKALDLYRSAYLQSSDEKQRSLLAHRFEHFTSKEELHGLYREHANQLLLDGLISPIKALQQANEVSLSHEKLKLLNSYQMALNIEQRKKVKYRWHILAISYKTLGDLHSKEKKIYSAIAAYQHAIQIYKTEVSESVSERIILYSDLMTLLMKTKAFVKMKILATEAETFIPELSVKHKIRIEKILYYKAQAILHEINQKLHVKNKRDEVLSAMQELETTMAKLSCNPLLLKEEFNNIQTQLNSGHQKRLVRNTEG